ncbi:hypothetical protein Tco_0018058 [Tanacetum coccineum]
MLAITAFHDYEIWQMDVKTAFLNGKLTEDVFMNLCFHEKVTQFGFSRSEDESCVDVKVSGSVVVFLVLYVDDILLIGNDIPTLQSVKDWYLRNTKDRFLVYGEEKGLRVTGYCDAAVTWKSSKQDTVADSTCESKYIAACELIIKKHIERKYHFVRNKVEEGHVIVKDIRSEDNPADPFTKALAKSKHDEHAKSIGLKDKIKF